MSLTHNFIVMGVSGCGKSSVGAALADRFQVQFIDGDDLHPAANIDKMARGEPLTDVDRAPWLEQVGRTIAQAGAPVFLGCSALRRVYRDIIRRAAGKPVAFLHLSGTREVLIGRMSNRPGHFMPFSLLDSQLATLEPPAAEEGAVTVNIDQPIDPLVEELVQVIEGRFTA